MFEELKVGGTYTQIAGRPEGTIFDFVGGGPVLIYNMYDPTHDEIEQCKAGHRFEMKILLGRFDKFDDAVAARKAAEDLYFKPIIEKYKK